MTDLLFNLVQKDTQKLCNTYHKYCTIIIIIMQCLDDESQAREVT